MSVGVVASVSEPSVGVFVVAEPSSRARPANGGLRLLPYANDAAAVAEGVLLAERMALKHDLYATGFSGGKIVARASEPASAKARVLRITRALLDALDGGMLTGCDLNVSAADMELLARRSPWVLAAVGHRVDASAATAHGVLGAFQASVATLPGGPVERVVVHGIGAVGCVVAEELVARGYDVRTVDRDPSRTVAGALPVPAHRWAAEAADAHVLCSATGLIDDVLAARLATRLVVSGANAPFSSAGAEAILAQRGARVLPDALANAGAVVVDSIEHYARSTWRRARPGDVYDFVRTLHRRKVALFWDRAERERADDVLTRLRRDGATEEPVGRAFAPVTPARLAG